nr:MAG TPA_asm: hypothetical protein [Caudoviricetes sp.]
MRLCDLLSNFKIFENIAFLTLFNKLNMISAIYYFNEKKS